VQLCGARGSRAHELRLPYHASKQAHVKPFPGLASPDLGRHSFGPLPLPSLPALRCSFAWAIAESSLIFSGLCYNGRNADVSRRLERAGKGGGSSEQLAHALTHQCALSPISAAWFWRESAPCSELPAPANHPSTAATVPLQPTYINWHAVPWPTLHPFLRLQGRPLWNRSINSRIRRVEFNASLPNLAANWNVCTGLWLRHCERAGEHQWVGRGTCCRE